MKSKKTEKRTTITIAALLTGCVVVLFLFLTDVRPDKKVEKTLPPIIPAAVSIAPVQSPPTVPDIPGLYESLLAKGLEPYAAAKEYCKQANFDVYWCDDEVLKTKQFTEYQLSNYGLDNDHVYLVGRYGDDRYKEFDTIDRASFVYLGDGFLKDKNHLYFYDFEGYTTEVLKIVTNVDHKTLGFMSSNRTALLYDAKNVYFAKTYELSENPAKYIKLEVVPGADPLTLTTSSKQGEDLEDRNNYYTSQYGELIVTPKNT